MQMQMPNVEGGGVLCWIDRVWLSKECVCCPHDPSVHLVVPSIGFVVYVGSYVRIKLYCTLIKYLQHQKMLYLSVVIPREFSTGIMSNFIQANTSLKVYNFTY